MRALPSRPFGIFGGRIVWKMGGRCFLAFKKLLLRAERPDRHWPKGEDEVERRKFPFAANRVQTHLVSALGPSYWGRPCVRWSRQPAKVPSGSSIGELFSGYNAAPRPRPHHHRDQDIGTRWARNANKHKSQFDFVAHQNSITIVKYELQTSSRRF